MQIRCNSCGRAVTVAATGVLPDRCPHCQRAPVPEQLGKWRIERLLAAGGMGEVYLARHCELQSRVAVKRLPPSAHGDAEALRQRFLREAQLTAAVDHPGVVRVLDCCSDGDVTYLVLEFLDGRSLRSLLRDGPLPMARALAIATAVADVLAAAHRQGVVHRDVKPENVLVGPDGGVRVLDFGIAKALADEQPITRTGEILGTPEYMAPEQLLEAASAIDARTDVHGLSVLLYELLTGRSPFHGQNLFAVLKLVESLVPPPPSSLRPEVPPALDQLLLRGLHKEPAQRFADAGEFAAALRALQPEPLPAPEPRRRRPLPAALLPAALLLAFGALLGLGTALLLPRSQPIPAAPAAADPRPALRALLDGPVADTAALAAARRALADHRDAEALLLRGRAALRLGSYQAAVQELDEALQLGADAAEPAAIAWLCAHTLLPAALGAPDWLQLVDRRRRDRLFGLGADDNRRLPATPLGRALALLAAGDAPSALQALRPAAGEHLDEPTASIALLAGRLAIAEPSALRQLAAELRPPQPMPSFTVLAASADGPPALAAALQDWQRQLDATAADRWLGELALAFLAAADAPPRLERLRAAGELAWLTGAGELAPLWAVGLRLQLAANRSPPLDADEAQRWLQLLRTGDADEHPARAVAQALLHTAALDRAAVAADLAGLPAAAPPLLAWRRAAAGGPAVASQLWRSYAQLLVGQPEPAPLQQLGDSADAQLVLALLEPTAERWQAALRGADFALLQLLRPLPGRALAQGLGEQIAAAAEAGVEPGALRPALVQCARLGNDVRPLLQRPALRALATDPAFASEAADGRR